LAWLQGAEATLTALDQKPIVNNLEQVEQLLVDHLEFQTEMQARQVKVDRITKSSSVKDYIQDAANTSVASGSSATGYSKKSSFSSRSINKVGAGASSGGGAAASSHHNHHQVGWRTPEPKMRNPRVKFLFDRWRKVWLLSMERQRKLREAIERLKEVIKPISS